MNRYSLALFSCFSFLAFVCAQFAQAQVDPVQGRLESSPRHHEWAEVEAQDGRKVKCWVVYPEVSDKATAVVVIHENRGLNDWARSVADQVAEAGFVAVAPDLLSGTGPDGGATDSYGNDDAARNGIYKLSPEQVQSDLDAVVAYAKELPAANGKVAVSGFCWGGGQAFAYAAHNPEIAAACVFYGSAPATEALQSIKAPVFGFYGGNDFRISGEVPKVADTMKELGKDYDPVIYEGAGHGFLRSGEAANASAADRKAHEEAWKRWREILGKL
jgi:carboxymethylenebutenolidase